MASPPGVGEHLGLSTSQVPKVAAIRCRAILRDRQNLFMKGDSTINQLLYIIHSIRLSWTKGCITQGIFLDVSSAFDKVWHKGLLAKLKQNCISEKVLDLFTSYLQNRKQIVVVDGLKSQVKPVNEGIPQGSKLGPLLFLLYINDITENIESDILIFADDTSLFANAKDPFETAEILNRDLARITAWALKWKVVFNADKSTDIIFSNKYLNNSPPIIFNNEYVQRVNVHRHLGIYLSSNLSWSRQIHETCLRANRKLSVLRRVKYLKRHTLDILYKITVRSIIDYGLLLYYNNCSAKECAKFDQIQYNAAKLVTNTLHYTSKLKLNQELGWESIQDRANSLGICLFNKILKGQTRPLVRTFMTEFDNNSTHDLRVKKPLKSFPFLGVHFSKSFYSYFTKMYNNIDKKTRNLPFSFT